MHWVLSVYAGTYVPRHVCGAQSSILESSFSPSTLLMWGFACFFVYSVNSRTAGPWFSQLSSCLYLSSHQRNAEMRESHGILHGSWGLNLGKSGYACYEHFYPLSHVPSTIRCFRANRYRFVRFLCLCGFSYTLGFW